MKRLLIVVVLAAALLAVLAAPALATRSDANWRPALQTAYVFTYNGGSWFEGTGDPSAPTIIGHWADWAGSDEEGYWVPGTADPIPANYDVVMQVSIKFIPRGQVQNLAKKFLISLSIQEAGVDLSYQQSKAYWNLHIWDQYWVDATDMPILAFNPHIGAQPYANTWLAPLTGDKGIATMNLTTDKKLAQGTYTVNYTESVVKPFTTLEIAWDDEGNPAPPTWEWTHVRPYTSDLVVFTFTVGLPV